jgi:hypothetical protein
MSQANLPLLLKKGVRLWRWGAQIKYIASTGGKCCVPSLWSRATERSAAALEPLTRATNHSEGQH